MEPARHSIHECRSAEEFCAQFEDLTGQTVRQITDLIVAPSVPKAVFLVGSLPLGMGTPGSDVDLIVLVDDRAALDEQRSSLARNTDQRLAFSNVNDLMRSGEFLTVINGVTVDVTVAIASGVKAVYGRLRSKGPQLTESEIMTLGRLSTGWLVWQSDGFLQRHALRLADPVLDVYCSTKNFVAALSFRQKGLKALDLRDVPLALHLGRSSVEMAYLAYFASEGYSYLGPKWLAQIGHAVGAAERVNRHPVLQQRLPLLFPSLESTGSDVTAYLRAVSEFLVVVRQLIERKPHLRKAFSTCPQIPDTGN